MNDALSRARSYGDSVGCRAPRFFLVATGKLTSIPPDSIHPVRKLRAAWFAWPRRMLRIVVAVSR